ncbi:MAG: MoaD/ThiS family protein [Pyrinomonadaceae bacterium]
MAVRVRFFGLTAELVGDTEIAQLISGTTVSGIVDRLIADYPGLANLDLKFAVNECYATPNTEVEWADEVAIFTAVSGG